MQTYTFSFTAQRGSTTIPSEGDLFVYESSKNESGEMRVKVRPDNGGEIVLRPGQRFRNPNRVRAWNITSYTGIEAVEGSFIIGEGEFEDSNIINTFKLDGTFSNTVTIDNTTDNRVPVSISDVRINNTTAQRVPVTLDPSQPLNVSGNIMAYTHSFAVIGPQAAGVPLQLLAAANNVNGAILNRFEAIMQPSSQMVAALLAKATAPINSVDGDVIWMSVVGTGLGKYAMEVGNQVKIPAGKALWYFPSNADGGGLKSALFTVF